jgi:hypothetical protein
VVRYLVNSIDKLTSSLNGALDNPNLNAELQQAYTDALDAIDKLTKEWNEAVAKLQGK